MKVKIKIEKEIELPDDLVISNLDRIDKESLYKLLREVKEQVKQYFSQEIKIRRPYLRKECECPYCRRTFDNTRALTTHKSQKHKLQTKDTNLFLSAHRVESSKNNFIYIILFILFLRFLSLL
ncbi:MAG: hypothetical protein ACOC1X_00380, partial [Promethearchaeota archaeon]